MHATRKTAAPLMALATLAALGLGAHPALAQSPETFNFTINGFNFYGDAGDAVRTDTTVNGSFTGTPGADGLIEFGPDAGNDGGGRDNILAFTATVSGSGHVPQTTFTLSDLKNFRYGVDPSQFGKTVLFVYANNNTDNVDAGVGVNDPSNDLGEQQTTLGPDGGSNTETSYLNAKVMPADAATPAPEPSSVAAFAFAGLGAAGLILRARKRRPLA